MIAVGIIAPILLAVLWVRKTHQPIKPLLIGAAIFCVFVIVLESFPKLLLFQYNNPVGNYVMSHTAIFTLTAALLAGLFEETGRFVAFKYLLKNIMRG